MESDDNSADIDQEQTFKFTFTPITSDGSKTEKFTEDAPWFDYNCDNLTNSEKVANSFDETSEFLTSLHDEISELSLSRKQANKVFELCYKLIDRVQLLNMDLIEHSNNMNASQVRILQRLCSDSVNCPDFLQQSYYSLLSFSRHSRRSLIL